MDFKNSDITSAHAITDLSGADAAVALEAAATLAVAMQGANILPLTADGQLVLPAGVGLDDIKVVGRDLVIQMPDGTQMIVPDGAVFVPQIVVDGVAVPPLNIAALLIGQEPQPAAGRPQSSGGNFADPVGDIGDPFGLGDLLPPTALAFPEPEEREIIPELNDEEPTTIIITPDQPAGSVSATASVNEAALPARGSEPAGSNEASNAETTAGSIVFDAPDGLGSITLNGVAITAVGQVFVTPLGRLTITSIAPGNIGYSYTLADNTTNPASNDVFAVVVTDSDGDTASANLTINIIDDAPTARNDTDSVPAANYTGQTGNVITGVGTTSGNAGADTPGADGAVLSGIRAGSGAGTFSGAGTTINGVYGTLTIAADGSYTYTRSAGTPGGVNDIFTYQLTDGDGDTSTATLTISIGDSPAVITFVPTIGDGTIVSEVGLPERGSEPSGSNPALPVETTSGTITFTAPDGPATVQINGVTITTVGQTIVTPTGILTITSVAPGAIGYSFTLADNTAGDATTQTFTVTVTDVDGDAATAPLTITIVDDTPTARNDSATQTTENAPVTVNVIANDTTGADGVSLTGGVVLVAGSLTGAGSVAYNNNGTFTYTPAPGEEGIVTFQYQITDGDGDTSTATVTITLAEDSVPFVEIAGDRDVEEAGLPARGGEPAGSDAASDSEIAVGTIFTGTGNDTIGSLVINGVNVTAGGIVVGASGTLTVTLSAGVYGYSYTLNDNTSGDATTDSFAVVLTDSDGDVANDTLVIAIVDDVPTAVADTDDVAAGSYAPATGNVVTDAAAGDAGDSDNGVDTQGADGVTVTAITGSAAGTVGGATNGTYGVLTINADGSYSYVRNAGTPGGVSDVFTYTITDADGDTSTTTLTIAIANSPTSLDLPVQGEAGTLVDEAGLPAGSNASADSEMTSGIINFVAPDGPAVVTIDGVAVTIVGQTFTGSFGTLTITSIANGVIGYDYLLTTNTSGDATFDDFAVVVADQDGDSSNGTLVIDIVDDVPTARADADSVTEDNFAPMSELVSADGNVLTGIGGSDANATDGVADTEGADGATVTAVAFGMTAGTVGGNTAGAYGNLTLNTDGSYTYVLNNLSPVVQGLDGDDSLTEIFTYVITDGDGDPSETTLTITINGSDDPITINGLNAQGPELIVDEDDLSDGSSPNAPALTQTGSFTVNGTDGIAEIKIEGENVAVGQTFATAFGVFEITSVSAPVDGNATSITIGYSYTLIDNTAHVNAGGENFLTETFAIEVTDTDGSTDSDTIEVRVIDDVPLAANDTDTVSGGSNAPATGNVITDAELDGGKDTVGADGATVTAITGASAGTVGGTTNGTYGVLTLNVDGSYSYTRNNGTPGNVEDVFTYEITDSDGDISPATLTIAIEDARPVVGPNAIVLLDDDALAGGIAGGTGDDADAANLTGTLSGSGGDGALTFALQTTGNPAGFTYVAGPGGSILVNQGLTTVLTITLDSATGAYSVTQNAPIVHATGDNENNQSFTINYTVTDVDLDSAAGTLTIDVDDDTPTVTSTGLVPTLTVDETVLATNAGPTSFAGAFTVAYGADGAGSTAYSLTVNTAIASGLVDTATGAAVVLSVAGNVVTGRAGAAGPVVFTLTVDPANGNVTLDQQRAVSHGVDGGPGAAHDDPASLVAGAISLTATATDRDGDSAAQTIAIGDRLVFEDDGPTLAAATPTAGDLTVDETLLGTDDTASFAGLFTPTYGADGAGSVGNYVLGVSAAGAASGVVDVATGNQVFLFLEAGVVVGREGANAGAAATGAVVFTVSINASGVATLDQQRAVVHNDPLDADEPGASAVTLAASLITLTATVTDGDGDTNTATANIGGAIRFEDDGPAIDAALGSDANVLLTTQDAETIGALTDSDVSTGNFSGVFTIASSSYGNDGAGTTVWNYGLSILNAASGLSSNGVPITLSPNAGVVEGRAGGALVFSISVNASTGVVTLTQFAEIDHSVENPTTAPFDDQFAVLANGLVQLTGTATITDKDGDSASETLNLDLGGNIRFADHGPTISSTGTAPTLTVDETNFGINAPASFAANFVTDFGADGAGTTAYALAVTAGPSGLIDTLTGQAVNLVLNGSVVEGRTAGSNELVFTVTVSAGGTVTLDQSRAVIHSPDTGPNQSTTLSAADLVRLTATSTDGDGDTASATINIGRNLVFLDDAPTANVVALTGTVDEDGLANGIAGGTGDVPGEATTATGFVTSLFNSGADTPLTYQLTGSTVGLPSLSSGGVAITYALAGNVLTASAGANPVFTLTLNEATGQWDFALLRAVDHPTGLNENDITVNFGPLIQATDRDGDPVSSTGSLTITIDDDSPTANVVALTGTVDEDGLANGIAGGTGDVAGEATTATGFVTTLFNSGADTPLTYQLTGSTAGLPALSSGGVAITYALAGNVLTASAGANPVFTLTLNSTTGQWDFVLLRPLDHTTGLNENDITINFGPLVQATDRDGDPVTATGSLTITVDDDTPLAADDTVDQLTENSSVTFSVFGNDGVGADGVDTTDVTPPAGVTFTQPATGTVSYNAANGQFTFTPASGQEGSTSFTYTIIDRDGDPSTATVTINLVPDSFPVVTNVVASVDDDGLAGGNPASTIDDLAVPNTDGDNNEATFSGQLLATFGADTPGSFSFASMGGTTGTVGTEMVNYTWSAGTNTLTATGPRGVLFTVQITNTATGAYTLTLRDNVLHATGPNNENAVDPITVLTFTASDSDSPADSRTGTLSVTFDDDAPSVFDPADAAVLNTNIAPTSFALNYANTVGADGLGNVVFNIVDGAAAVDSNGNALSFNGEALFIFGNGTNVLTARTSVANGSDVGYTITIVPGTDQYILDVNGTISNGTEFSINNLSSSAAGNVDFRAIGVDDPASVLDIILSGRGSGGGVGSVNTDSNSIGIDNQSVSAGEAVRIDFVSNLQTAATTSGLSFANHTTVTTFSQFIPQVQGAQNNTASIRVTAILADNDQVFDNTPATPEAGETLATITSVRVQDFSTGTFFTFVSGSPAQAGASVTFNGDGSVTISGLQEGDRYEINTSSAFSAVVVEGSPGTTEFDLGIFSVITINTATPISFDYDVTGTDGDGDSVSVPDAIKVTLNPVTPPVVLDLDGDGVEFVSTAAGVTFDYAGDGSAEHTAWVGSDDGLLVLDKNGDGLVNDGSEIVFARNGLTDLQGLAADYDSNHDGVLTAADDSFALFGVWQDANSNGVTDAGEYRTLSDAGIVSVGVVSDGLGYLAADGDVSVAGQSTYTKADGSSGIVADAAFATAATQSGQGRSFDQIRSGNLTTSIVAASLVGLVGAEVAAAATTTDGPRIETLHAVDTGAPDGFVIAGDPRPTVEIDLSGFEPANDFAQSSGDVSSSLRRADDTDFAADQLNQPVRDFSEASYDGSDKAAISDILQNSLSVGGDAVMHNILDIAAATLAVASNDNPATDALADLVANALPEATVDRLIEAFDADIGSFAVNGGGSDNNAYLLNLINQNVGGSQDFAHVTVDVLGSQSHDVIALNNA